MFFLNLRLSQGNCSLSVLTTNLLAQVYLPCYFGTRITAKSEMLMSHVYSSNWMDLALWPKRGKKYKHLMFVLWNNWNERISLSLACCYQLIWKYFLRQVALPIVPFTIRLHTLRFSMTKHFFNFLAHRLWIWHILIYFGKQNRKKHGRIAGIKPHGIFIHLLMKFNNFRTLKFL